jgi:hypothetical protein
LPGAGSLHGRGGSLTRGQQRRSPGSKNIARQPGMPPPTKRHRAVARSIAGDAPKADRHV